MNRAFIAKTISECIGNTPILKFTSKEHGSALLLKLEKFNPNGSMKDRMALNMVLDAEKRGHLKPGGTIVESTSGNTGVGLAMVAAERGYQFIAVVDNHAAKDKIKVMEAYGAKIISVGKDHSDDLATADRDTLAEEIAQKTPGAYWTKQHDNPANADAYVDTMALEILEITNGNMDILIGAVGTGGSLCGTGRKLKSAIPNIKVIGVEPEGSIIFGGEGKPYYQSGTGTPAGAKVGDVIDYKLIDEGVKVSDQKAFNTVRYFARNYGVLIGGSSGGVIYEALQYIQKVKKQITVAAIIADGGEKYLDTIFDDQWMVEKNLLDDTVSKEIASVLYQTKGSFR